MAGIADTTVVDLVAQEADGTYLLIMIEERPWGATEHQALQLRDKINAYVGYILEGGLARRFPETAGQTITIRLDCLATPNADFAYIISYMSEQVARLGIGLRVKPTR